MEYITEICIGVSAIALFCYFAYSAWSGVKDACAEVGKEIGEDKVEISRLEDRVAELESILAEIDERENGMF